MTRIHSLALSFAILSTAAITPLAAVAAVPVTSPVHALFFFSDGEVRFSLRNDTAAPIDLKAGDNTVTLAPGKTLSLKLPIGTRIQTAAATGTRPAGDLIAQVSSSLKNSTIVLH